MKYRQAIAGGLLMATVITVVAGLGVSLSYWWGTDAPLSVVVAATAVFSFVGLLALAQGDEERWELTESSMRTAIAGAVVIVYLVLVGIVAFFKAGPEQLPAISQTLVTNFTTIVGVVIAFYFGASAYVQARTSEGRTGAGSTPRDE